MTAPMPPAEHGSASPKRTVHCAEALAWLQAQPVMQGCSFVTSLPDVSETPLPLAEWREWFTAAARAVLERCPDDGVALFFQTDIRKAGLWIDKGFLVGRAADALGVPTLFHKIVCRLPPGTRTSGRASYSHLLAFSRGVQPDLSIPTPDVLPEGGEKTWVRGMGVEACRLACEFVLASTKTRTIVDPFCGHGTALAVANALGLDAIGVELSPKRARKAGSLQLSLG